MAFPAQIKQMGQVRSKFLMPGIFGDRWEPMSIPIRCRGSDRLPMSSGDDANFAVGDRNCIGYLTNDTDVSR